MYKRKLNKKQYLILAAGLILALLCVFLTLKSGRSAPKDMYSEALEAAEKMQKCMDAVKTEKYNRGIVIPPEDRFSTGLIGEDFNFITTTLGDISAKRTTANPDMAAMMVFMLDEAGLSEGDTLGCNFSGSFPSLNIATICACDALGIKPVYICSCGASTWGANNPELCFPEMAALLYEKHLISTPPALITPGGGDDVGSGMDPDMLGEIWSRVESLGYPLMVERDFGKNISERQKLFDSAGIGCFISVGGNITSLGYNMITDTIGQGILNARINTINAGSGLLEIYLNRGVSSILLLNIRQLAADRGFAFDPDSLAIPGTSSMYYKTVYSKLIIWVGLASELALLILYRREEKMCEDRQRYKIR